MPIPFVRLYDPQPKTEQFSLGMMTNYLSIIYRSYLKLSKQRIYHEKLDEFEDHTLLSEGDIGGCRTPQYRRKYQQIP